MGSGDRLWLVQDLGLNNKEFGSTDIARLTSLLARNLAVDQTII